MSLERGIARIVRTGCGVGFEAHALFPRIDCEWKGNKKSTGRTLGKAPLKRLCGYVRRLVHFYGQRKRRMDQFKINSNFANYF